MFPDLLTRIFPITVFATEARSVMGARKTATVIRTLCISANSIFTWIFETFVDIIYTMASFPAFVTDTLIYTNTIKACIIGVRILTWIGSTIINVDITILPFVTRVAYTFIGLKNVPLC